MSAKTESANVCVPLEQSVSDGAGLANPPELHEFSCVLTQLPSYGGKAVSIDREDDAGQWLNGGQTPRGWWELANFVFSHPLLLHNMCL